MGNRVNIALTAVMKNSECYLVTLNRLKNKDMVSVEG